jgi:hypothetical protein
MEQLMAAPDWHLEDQRSAVIPNSLLHDCVQELIDAHVDTIELVLGGEDGARWGTHVAYLQRLVRVATGVAARELP